jgi:TetR/AcrR family transcriptional regulator, regulator of cefoperazone and chloramphenicol sensitivity
MVTTTRKKIVAHEVSPRHRILYTALKLFAEQGFKKTSVRDIAKKSSANISAIAYYFGDKEGLYKAAFTEPLDDHCFRNVAANLGHSLALDFPAALRMFYGQFLAPLSSGEQIRAVMKLHFREMLEPTGLWNQVIEHEIEPDHKVMLGLLTNELGLKKPDLDVQRLAISLIGMAVHYFVGQDVVTKIAPQVLANPKAIEVLADRLSMYGVAMVAAEKARRKLDTRLLG